MEPLVSTSATFILSAEITLLAFIDTAVIVSACNCPVIDVLPVTVNEPSHAIAVAVRAFVLILLDVMLSDVSIEVAAIDPAVNDAVCKYCVIFIAPI